MIKKFLFTSLFLLASLAYAETANIDDLVFVTPERTVEAGQLSEIMSVQTQNSAGTGENIGSTADVEFSSDSDTGEFLNDQGNPVSLVMAKNSAKRNFYYRDSDEGEHEITVTVTIRDTGESWSASQDITVGEEDEAEEEIEDDDEEEGDDENEEEEEVDDDQDEDEEGADEEENDEDEDEKEVKKKEKQKETPKTTTKTPVLNTIAAVTPPPVPAQPLVPVPTITPEVLKELNRLRAEVAEKDRLLVAKAKEKEKEVEELTVEATTQAAVVVETVPALPQVEPEPLVLPKKLGWWQRFLGWLFGR